ncbi:GAP family protein [Microbacterium elymi]|uniref:GAP family protein n=1 Tax=Microbacterium elymi TaxID=2909587 RepID=A0ABY5NNK3_9MICO|nr:GAP family protein [Microbacterium elymi]UUT36730.1 GAP family protein [Microbacterium elymi]
MGAVIGEILPLALGIAISPIPIIAAILMLLSPKARVTSVGFLLGWVAGIVVAVVVFTLLSSILPADDPSVSKPILGVVRLVLGALRSCSLSGNGAGGRRATRCRRCRSGCRRSTP